MLSQLFLLNLFLHSSVVNRWLGITTNNLIWHTCWNIVLWSFKSSHCNLYCLKICVICFWIFVLTNIFLFQLSNYAGTKNVLWEFRVMPVLFILKFPKETFSYNSFENYGKRGRAGLTCLTDISLWNIYINKYILNYHILLDFFHYFKY